jgi:hypothetical protein
MKLSVPYYSQFVDVEDSFWMLRACGATCLKMVVEYHLPVDTSNREGAKVPSIVELCNEAKESGGYDMHNGWIHNYLVSKAKELGLNAHRTEREVPIVDEIIASLEAGNPVIVSVEKRVLEQTRFHMIVIVGYEKSEETEVGVESEFSNSYRLQSNSFFYYHEPESTDKTRGAYRSCDVETFKQYWRGKAIFITK